MSRTGERPSLRCVYHPDRSAFAACFECADQLCGDCTQRGDDGLARCAACLSEELNPGQHPYDAVEPPLDEQSSDRSKPIVDVVTLGTEPSSPGPQAPGEEFVPWENKRHISDLGAFVRTVSIGIFRPFLYMEKIPWQRADLMTPLIFAVLAGMWGQVGQIARLLANPQHIEEALKATPEIAHLSPTMIVLCMIPLMPLAIAVGLFLKSWIAHALLKLLNATGGPFETTFRVFAYAEVANVLFLVPILGPYAQKFYVVFLVLNGLRSGHGAGLGAGLLALMPMLLLQTLAQ